MLDKVDFGAEPLSKGEYEPVYDDLVERLIVLQQRARTEGVGLVVLFEGWNGAGKGSRISELMFNLDARAASVFVPEDIDPADSRAFVKHGMGVKGFYPFMQQYWKALGERGTMTFVDRGWYTSAVQLMMARSRGNLAELREGARNCAQSIHDFEQQLVNDGYVVVKLFLHVREEAQKERLERLRNNPATRWRVPDKKLASTKNYEEAYTLFDKLLTGSNFDFAPWVLVNGEDKRRARLTIARTLVEAIEGALAKKAKACKNAEAADAEARADSARMFDCSEGKLVKTAGVLVVDASDAEQIAAAQHAWAPRESRFPIMSDYPSVDELSHSLTLDKAQYKNELKRLQKKLFRLENIMYQKRVPLMIMYEGWDAAGKGGNIKRVAQALDARSYTIFPSPAPTPTELAHPHLWRYWTRLPKAGHVAMYDRSWYGRVLVERVEGFATPEQWARAYEEINEFERSLVDWAR